MPPRMLSIQFTCSCDRIKLEETAEASPSLQFMEEEKEKVKRLANNYRFNGGASTRL